MHRNSCGYALSRRPRSQIGDTVDFTGLAQPPIEFLGPDIRVGTVTDQDDFSGIEQPGDLRQIGDAEAVEHLNGFAPPVGPARCVLGRGRRL